MARIQLRLYVNPGEVEVFVNIRQKTGDDYPTMAKIDTGAAISLLPEKLMPQLDYELVGSGTIELEQAGIAQQSFKAVEARVNLSFQDELGNQTVPRTAVVWFADTHILLIGFRDLLEHAILHIDMPHRDGWIEID